MESRAVVWDKPGPGTWELDSSHCGPAPGPILRNIYQECLQKGMAEGFALFGSPLKGMEMRWVNGKFYRRLVPIVGGGRDMPAPPAPVLWLAARIHPAFRTQEKRARESFEQKRWRAELREWERNWKPSIVDANLAFADTDVAALDDAALGRHLTDVYDHLRYTTALHFRLHVSDMGPLGNLMVHLEQWGIDPAKTFHALGAASPATVAPVGQLEQLATALRDAGVDPTSIASLDEVRAASTTAAAHLDAYLRLHGWRLTTGYDIEDKTLAELPQVVVASIRAAGARPTRFGGTSPEPVGQISSKTEGEGVDVVERAIAELRAQVPPEHRATFDDLVEDARLSYGLRDENGPITYEWPAGLLRRAVLEAGRRLATADKLDAPLDVFELDTAEIAGLLTGAAAPSKSEIAERAATRRWWASLDPPERLGPEEAPPPVGVLPPNLARITRIVLAVIAALEADRTREPLTGLGIGDAPYVGVARVVSEASEALAVVEPGDVIVTPYTAPTYNAVLAVAGAVVTEQGGLLCHAAVLARELGLPAVVGAADAMQRIPDGATVEVDPKQGRVTVVG